MTTKPKERRKFLNIRSCIAYHLLSNYGDLWVYGNGCGYGVGCWCGHFVYSINQYALTVLVFELVLS